MERLVLAATVALVSAPALAADLGVVYDPLPIETPTYNQSYNWTGAYVGGHVGWAWDESHFDIGDEPPAKWWASGGPNSTSFDTDGFIGGGQIGYWYQPNNVVFGVDLSASWSDLSSSKPSPAWPVDDTWSSGIDWFLLAQARLGVANGRWLAFLQGGYAGVKGSASAVSTSGIQPLLGASDHQWHNGWTVGAGVAVKATRQLSLGVEYNYVDAGSKSYDLTGCGSCTVDDIADVDHKFHVVKGTINLHFNGN